MRHKIRCLFNFHYINYLKENIEIPTRRTAEAAVRRVLQSRLTSKALYPDTNYRY